MYAECEHTEEGEVFFVYTSSGRVTILFCFIGCVIPDGRVYQWPFLVATK